MAVRFHFSDNAIMGQHVESSDCIAQCGSDGTHQLRIGRNINGPIHSACKQRPDAFIRRHSSGKENPAWRYNPLQQSHTSADDRLVNSQSDVAARRTLRGQRNDLGFGKDGCTCY